MSLFKKYFAIFSVIVAGGLLFKDVEGNPDPHPLVSSSGMMSMQSSQSTTSTPSSSTNSTLKPSSIIRSFPDGQVAVVQRLNAKSTTLPPVEKIITATLSINSTPTYVKDLIVTNAKPNFIPNEAPTTLPRNGSRIIHTSETIKTVEAIEKDILMESLSDNATKKQKPKKKKSRKHNNSQTSGIKRDATLSASDFDEDITELEGDELNEENYGDDDFPGSSDGGSPGTSDGGAPDVSHTPHEKVDDGDDGGIVIGFDENAGDEEDNAQAGNQDDSSEANEDYPFYKPGPPWEDSKVVGKLFQDGVIDPVEISFNLASKLCSAIGKKYPSTSRFYLWAPVNQYVPLIHKAFPIRPPVFSPECLKWVHRPCRGRVRAPMLKPCSYWFPMRIRRPECGFIPDQEHKMVNHRPTDFIPGNCPCVWPCIKRFDPIQRCRVPTSEEDKNVDNLDSKGEPKNEGKLEIQLNYAQQLCRGMKTALTLDHPIPIGWVPVRIQAIIATGGRGARTKAHKKKKRSHSLETRSKVRTKRGLKAEGGKRLHRRDDTEAVHDADDFAMTITYDPDSNMNNGQEDPGDAISVPAKSILPKFSNKMSSSFTEDMEVFADANVEHKAVESIGSKCDVWKFKACPKKDSDEIETKGSDSKGVRRKRRLKRHSEKNNTRTRRDGSDSTGEMNLMTMSFDDDENDVEAVVVGGIKDESEHDTPMGNGDNNNGGSTEDHEIKTKEEEKCGSWYMVTSDSCTPEVFISKEGDEITASDIEKKSPYVKDPCPGSEGKFPCFISRRKRDTSPTQEGVHTHIAHTRMQKAHTHSGHGPFNQKNKITRQKQVKNIMKRGRSSLTGVKILVKKENRKNATSESGDVLRKRRNEINENTRLLGNKTKNNHGRHIHRRDNEAGSFNKDDDFTMTLTYEPEDNLEVGEEEPEVETSDIYGVVVGGGGGVESGNAADSLISRYSNKIRLRQDPVCRCDWPCLPFYDSINKCYDAKGRLIVDRRGNPVVNTKSFRKYQKGPVVCINFEDNEEIYCRIKGKKMHKY